MTLEVVQEILFADSPILMSHVPHHRWTVINDSLDGEIAHNLADGLRGIDIDLIHIRVREYPFSVLISLQPLENGITEARLYGHYDIHALYLIIYNRCKVRKIP